MRCFEIIGRVSGRRLQLTIDPAQKGDMRHTYADTSLARAELGFATVGRSREGACRRVRMAERNPVMTRRRRTRWMRPVAALLVVAAAAACGSRNRGLVPPGTIEPDKFLFDRGTAALNAKKWLQSREFFKQIVETYTQSPYRPDAKLGVGDTYLGEGSSEALVLAINEFREFLSFYPTNRRADYAQYKLGIAHFRQMRGSQRDQTETREAVKEFETLIERYPNSMLVDEAKERLRLAQDRLSQADYEVGHFYYRQRWYPGAVDRFKTLLKQDPEYTGPRRRVLLPRRIARQDQAPGRGAPLLRAARSGISDERVPPGRPQADHRAQDRSRYEISGRLGCEPSACASSPR